MELSNINAIESAKEHFGKLLEQQIRRVDLLLKEQEWTDYSGLSPIVIGMIGGDGIGPTISLATQKVLQHMLSDEESQGKIKFKTVEGLTIENREKHNKSIEMKSKA